MRSQLTILQDEKKQIAALLLNASFVLATARTLYILFVEVLTSPKSKYTTRQKSSKFNVIVHKVIVKEPAQNEMMRIYN